MPDLSAVNALLHDAVYQVTFYGTRAFLTFLQRDSFLYWPFLISTVVTAMAAWRFGYASGGTAGPASWREFFRRFFGGTLWWHPSARADYRF